MQCLCHSHAPLRNQQLKRDASRLGPVFSLFLNSNSAVLAHLRTFVVRCDGFKDRLSNAFDFFLCRDEACLALLQIPSNSD